MKKITPLDIIIIVFFVVVIVVTVKIQFFSGASQSKKLYIYTDKDKYYYDTEKNQVINIAGSSGITKIEIKDNKFRFVESPCPNKSCIKMGWVSLNNLSIVCLPNRVSAYLVEDRPKKSYDGITR